MKLYNNYWMSFNRKREIWTNIRGQVEKIEDLHEINVMMRLRRVFSSKNTPDTIKYGEFLAARMEMLRTSVSEDDATNVISQVPEKTELDDDMNRQYLKSVMSSLIDFFKDASFSPNFRFVNTLARVNAFDSSHAAATYVANYFALTDNPDKEIVREKLNSSEFNAILDDLKKIAPTKKINDRFILYYGAQGTGKTTSAISLANGKVTVCHSAMLPSDLMEDFKFENGQPTFIPSALQLAMTNGEPIVLDEINLLPFESLRFLQSILDGKSSFEYKGKTINIADGFKIYGTMNLQVNGMIYPLPEPLVDRAEELKEFVLTEEDLVGAII